MLADYIYDGIISLYNLALETLFNIARLNIYFAIKKIKKVNKYILSKTINF